jgi:membrane protein YqaA with SNARE-associated domain
VTHWQEHDAAAGPSGDVPAELTVPVAVQELKYRLWFICFGAWLVMLALASRWGSHEIDQGGSALGWGVWMLALTAVYLSLCCSFFPAPTTWIILLAASDMIAGQVGIVGHGLARLVVVATVCAVASSLANLNEYYIIAYLAKHHRIAKIRQTRLYIKASGWFRESPFWILTLFSFVPIPVDVIRWLAVLAHYDRAKFVLANFVGRWFRYAVCALASLGLDLTPRQILIIQAALVGVALLKFILRRVRGKRGGAGGPEPASTRIVGGVEGA